MYSDDAMKRYCKVQLEIALDKNPGDAINVRRFSRPVHSTTLPISLVRHRIIVAHPVSAGAIIPE